MSKDLQLNAMRIANIMRKTDTEKRGDLLLMVSKALSKQTQHYSASLFEQIAQEYGVHKEGG